MFEWMIVIILKWMSWKFLSHSVVTLFYGFGCLAAQALLQIWKTVEGLGPQNVNINNETV